MQPTNDNMYCNQYVHLRHAPGTYPEPLPTLYEGSHESFHIWVLAYLGYVLRGLAEISKSIIVCRRRFMMMGVEQG